MATAELMFHSKGKLGKAWRWSLRRGGARCDACGADCGGWVELLAHLQKKAKHPGREQVLADQRERVEEVVSALRSPRRKAA